MSDRALTIAAWLYLSLRTHWRALLELSGLTLLVTAAVLVEAVAGVAVAGVALLVYAAFGARGA